MCHINLKNHSNLSTIPIKFSLYKIRRFKQTANQGYTFLRQEHISTNSFTDPKKKPFGTIYLDPQNQRMKQVSQIKQTNFIILLLSNSNWTATFPWKNSWKPLSRKQSHELVQNTWKMKKTLHINQNEYFLSHNSLNMLKSIKRLKFND